MAVNFEIHFDAQLRRRVRNEPIMQMTRGEFGGRVGIWRLMDLFDTYGIKATIFTPGRICELYPESLKEAVKRGHEVGNHMWEHRVPTEPELEKDHLRKATTAVEELCGKRPVGSRSRHKLSSLKSEGYIYVSRDDEPLDDVPYYLYDNKGNCMLNFPFHFVLDDAMHYYSGFFESGIAGQRPSDPSKVYDIWLSAFRQLYKMGRHMTICLHNFVSGRAFRVAMLERLIIEMKKMPRVWFPTYEEMARYCLDRFPPRLN
ncbi:MAG: polysaccharide deacetylase family protein [Deltaproteobacteria bacterium]|nr:polysaccharide deacetylase family protein [Deltaproteobacteria bacterium]MBW2306967.1 polysaccharide deacetylase family protein [Deltaproteobacteria bacterium]